MTCESFIRTMQHFLVQRLRGALGAAGAEIVCKISESGRAREDGNAFGLGGCGQAERSIVGAPRHGWCRVR
ncbi:MAG TPA: hypothetical protein VL752_19140, partial [Acidisoma sp.]|uniref:hypothetical protein n=1 Tax=Acidisoma sp. TaxID=1872115 RepID=UPI002C815848